MLNFYLFHQMLNEQSPDTVIGSFTPDLIASKNWLCKKLKPHVKSKPNIYVLGSWFGNIVLSIIENDIPFKNIKLVEIDNNKLQKARKMLCKVKDKLDFIHADANKLKFDDADVIINTSCNEMQKEWFDKVPKNCLVAIQARNKANNPVTVTNNLKDFDKHYKMTKTFYLGKRNFEDPELAYIRYMKIGLK